MERASSSSMAGQEQATDAPISCRIQSTGALTQNFNARIARSPKELVRSNDGVLVVALPVNGHKSVMEKLAPEIVGWMMERQIVSRGEFGEGEIPIIHIIISSHASLGAVYFMQMLRHEINARKIGFKG